MLYSSDFWLPNTRPIRKLRSQKVPLIRIEPDAIFYETEVDGKNATKRQVFWFTMNHDRMYNMDWIKSNFSPSTPGKENGRVRLHCFLFKNRQVLHLKISQINLTISRNIVVSYPEAAQLSSIPSQPANLLRTCRLIRTTHHNNRDAFRSTRNHILQRHQPKNETYNDNRSPTASWTATMFYSEHQEKPINTFDTDGQHTQLTNQFDTFASRKSSQDIDRVFNAENFGHVRFLDLAGHYANGDEANDAFIYSADLAYENQTISGAGGDDCGFLLSRYPVSVSVKGWENQIDIVSSDEKKSQASFPTTYSYLNMTMLKGRPSVPDNVYVELVSCSFIFWTQTEARTRPIRTRSRFQTWHLSCTISMNTAHFLLKWKYWASMLCTALKGTELWF